MSENNSNMFNMFREEIEWGGRTLSLETGKIARQATGAVMAAYGGTTVLATVVASKEAKDDIDFFPLMVEYVEKMYAVGRIPGGFLKREGKPTENEILTARLIDRPIRPLFPDNFYNDTIVSCTVLSYDKENNPDIVAMIAASAAITISGLPFNGPIAGVRVGIQDGGYILNPIAEAMKTSDLDLIVAGTKDSVMMIESEANILTEEQMLNAIAFGHEQMQPVIDMIREFASKAGKPKWELKAVDNSLLENKIASFANDKIIHAYSFKDKASCYEALDAMKKATMEFIKSNSEEEVKEVLIAKILHNLEAKYVRGMILNEKKRIDGRGLTNIRNIQCEIGKLARTHGSSYFTRGETQAIVVTTLGSSQDAQRMDSVHGDESEAFMLHYNFPPFSVGEARPSRAPGRREIGHGKLAWRAINPVLPGQEFPYTIRVVSEITESNGSSSMATVCGTSLSLMDAGVPIKSPVSGIAMGLIKEKDQFAVLSDILGTEDHLGDMDFKVAGPKEGITSLQMDIKIQGINLEIMKVALEQAKQGRLHILNIMNQTIDKSRSELNEFAPRITTITIPKEKISEVIGSKGKVIQEICAQTNSQIDIKDDGTVTIAAVGEENSIAAVNIIKSIIAEAIPGTVYNGKVIKIIDSGAIVQFLGKKDGMVRIGDIANEHVEDINDYLTVDQSVKVLYIGSDNRGRSKLSIRRVDQNSGEILADEKKDNYSSSSSSDQNNDNFNNERYNRNDSDGDDNRGNRRYNRDRNQNKRNDDSRKKRRFF